MATAVAIPTTTATPTREARGAHAIALAEAAHLTYTARLVEVDGEASADLGAEWFSVPSRDRRTRHIVTHDLRRGRWTCDCTAGGYGRLCCHVGAALHYARHRAQAMSAAACEAQRTYEAFVTWLDQQGL